MSVAGLVDGKTFLEWPRRYVWCSFIGNAGHKQTRTDVDV
jgi:hypothetical protein